MPIKDIHVAQRSALVRLMKIAQRDTGQSRIVADFLLAWHNAPENGGWNPVDIWAVDGAIAQDILTAIVTIRVAGCYPPELGFEKEIQAIWKRWRGPKVSGAADPAIQSRTNPQEPHPGSEGGQ